MSALVNNQISSLPKAPTIHDDAETCLELDCGRGWWRDAHKALRLPTRQAPVQQEQTPEPCLLLLQTLSTLATVAGGA